MHSTPGRHRKPSPTATIVRRTAISAGAAAAAVLVSAGGASAASPTNVIPCTGGPLDSVTKSITLEYCGGGPAIQR